MMSKYNNHMALQYKPVQGMSINEGLERENAENLKWYARLLGANKKIIRKPQLIDFISAHLTGDRLREVWSRLDEIQQAAVAETIYSKNLRFDETRFKAKYGLLPSFGTEHYYYRAHAKHGPTLARLLLHHGMPGELAERLKEFVPQPAPTQINISTSDRDHEGLEHAENEPNEETIIEMEQAAQRDLKVLLRLIKEGKLRVSDKTGFPTGVSMKPEREFLIRHPQPSKDFTLIGYDSLLKSDVYFRKRVFGTNLLATFPAVGGVSTIVIGQAENTDKKTSTPWAVTVLHEHSINCRTLNQTFTLRLKR